MQVLEQLCDYFYRDSLIPVFIYKNHTLIRAFPSQTSMTYPPDSYLDILWLQNSPLSYITTNFHSFFGCIQLQENSNLKLVIGPVSNVPYASEVFRIMYREYFITPDNRNEFENYFLNISIMTLSSFLNKLLFLNYALNHTPLLLSDIIDMNQSKNLYSVVYQQVENIYNNKENGSFNNSYEIEKKIISMIEAGKLDEFKSFTASSPPIHEGIIAPNAIRQVKNTSIVMLTLATRAAIRGGLAIDIAFQLSDLYIQKIEQLTTIETIYKLNYDALSDFTYRVSTSQIPITSDDVIQKAIQYVVKNTNVRLTVSDVANYLGFSRSYFTHRFKKELGFDLSSFIMRCKLEESKYLLAYTDKTISDISNYLCFSSQSHFQTTFKKKYGMTPLEYRKKPMKNSF